MEQFPVEENRFKFENCVYVWSRSREELTVGNNATSDVPVIRMRIRGHPNNQLYKQKKKEIQSEWRYVNNIKEDVHANQ